jgi:hypothetical protein
MIHLELKDRAIRYAEQYSIGLDLQTPLGHGTDGSVWKSSRRSAIKALVHANNYIQERECYQRFTAAGITELLGFSIPRLLAFNDELQIIEMTLVKAPFILDFAKAYIDTQPDFSQEVWQEWDEQGRELFETRWNDVRKLISALRQFGIYYLDAKPGKSSSRNDDLDGW